MSKLHGIKNKYWGKRIYRIGVAALAVALMVGLLPLTAFAAGEVLAFSGAGISNPTLVAVGQSFTLGVACESAGGRVANVQVTITCGSEINATNSQSTSMLPIYFDNLAFTTPGNKTITATGTINGVSCSNTYNITVQAPKGAMPTAAIDYVSEKIAGLESEKNYHVKVNGAGGGEANLAANAAGEIAINSAWMNGVNANFEIHLNGDGSTYVDSETQTLTIPARPAAPGVTAIPAATNGGTGGISGTTAAMEYGTSATGPWTACAAGSTSGLAQGTYYVRTKAIAGMSFASEQTTVTIAAASSKAITSFTLAGAAGTINEAAGTIAVTVPYGTNVTNLAPTITHTGASVSPASGAAQNFTNPVTYTVTAADNSTKNYVVTVTVSAQQNNNIGGGGWIPPAPTKPAAKAPKPAFPASGQVVGKRIYVYKHETLKTTLFRLNKGEAFTVLGLANKGRVFRVDKGGREGYVAFKDIVVTFETPIRATALKKAAAYTKLENGKLKRAGYYSAEQTLWIYGISGKYLINKQKNATYYLNAAQWRLWLPQ